MIAELAIIAIVISGSVIVSIVRNRRNANQLRQLSAERSAETICTFVRSLDYRRLDPRVIRAVYEWLQQELSWTRIPKFPLRPTDRLAADLRLDLEDVEFTLQDLARRCNRTLDGFEGNPHYPEISTVGGIIRFLSYQPRINASGSAR